MNPEQPIEHTSRAPTADIGTREFSATLNQACVGGRQRIEREQAIECLRQHAQDEDGAPLRLISDALESCLLPQGQLTQLSPDAEMTVTLPGEGAPSVWIAVSRGISVKNGAKSRPLPVGYPLVEAESFEGAVSVSAGAQGAFLLQIPLSDFAGLCRSNAAFSACFDGLVQAAFAGEPLPDTTMEVFHRTRGQNTLSMVTRAAIRAIMGPEGILRILNPAKEPVESPFEPRFRVHHIGATQQIWALVRSISNLAWYFSREELAGLAKQARAKSEEFGYSQEHTAGLALHHFRILVNQREQEFAKARLPLSSSLIESVGFPRQQKEVIMSHVVEVAWLLSFAAGVGPRDLPESVDQKISGWLKGALEEANVSGKKVEKLLDGWIEDLFESLPGIQGIDLAAPRHHKSALSLAPPPGINLPRSHPSYVKLENLRHRLMELRETSALGGSAYAAGRLPDAIEKDERDLLDEVASAQVEVVAYLGRHEDGINYVRWHAGTLKECLELPLAGVYGNFARSLLCFPSGKLVLLISHLGQSRQLANAGALLLYRNQENERVPLDKLTLVNGVQDLKQTISDELTAVLQRSEHEAVGQTVLGCCVKDPRRLPTQVMIMLHPQQIQAAFKQDVAINEYFSPALGAVYIGYMRNRTGGLTRLVVPTVGGSGLYGDTAGLFTAAAFDPAVIPELIPHVFFSATAGVFANTDSLPGFLRARVRGLPAIEPGTYVMPEEEIHWSAGLLPMNTLVAAVRGRPELQPALEKFEQALKQAGVRRYSRHYCVSHPGDETYEKILTLIQHRLVAGIDVEAGWIQKAVLEAQEKYPRATFTPLYIGSDDPRVGRDEPFHTLAWCGPLHDNTGPDNRLNLILPAMVELSFEEYMLRERAEKGDRCSL